MRRAEVRWYTFRAPDKRRPVVILTRNTALTFLTNVTVAPVTSTIRSIPTEVLLTPDDDAVPSACVVKLDNLQTVQQHQIGALITTLSAARMIEVERALCFALGMDNLLGKV
jgi:mRNA interferase MazF